MTKLLAVVALWLVLMFGAIYGLGFKFASGLEAQQRQTSPSTALLTDATTVSAGTFYRPISVARTFHAYGATSSGAGSATIVIEVSNIEVPASGTAVADWITLGTITLTLGTTRVSDGITSSAPWRNVRARVSAITGTGATVSVRMGS